jgi:hypothetical protein
MSRRYLWRKSAGDPLPGVDPQRCYAIEKHADEHGVKANEYDLLGAPDGAVVLAAVPIKFLEECTGQADNGNEVEVVIDRRQKSALPVGNQAAAYIIDEVSWKCASCGRVRKAEDLRRGL